MITALLLAAAVAGQVNDEPVAKQASPADPPVAFVPAPEAKPAKKAPRKADAKAMTQAQSVVNARKARRAKYNQREAAKVAQEQADYKQQLVEQEKAIKEYQKYVIKMGPIWAAENANAIQAQRNALIAQQTQIMKQQADNDAWLLMQIRNSR
jgi:hypothetical protein